MSALVSLEIDRDGVAELRMHDEAGKNGFSEPFLAALVAAVNDAAENEGARVVLLRGLPEVFCSGAPHDLLLRLVTGRFAPADIVLARQVLDLPIPLVAAMEGHATGGGFALGLCADIVLMARESRYGCNFINMGFTPGMGTTRLLEHVLSPAVAHELLLTGELRRGADFAKHGGINHILPRAEVLPKALDLARRIAEKPRGALVTLKRTLSIRRRQAFEESRTIEALMHEVSFASEATRQRIEEEYVR